MPVATRLYPEFSAHLMRVTETADWLEWQDGADPVIDEPFELRDGVLIFPDRPGSSIECNEEAIDRFGYDALADGLSPAPLIGTSLGKKRCVGEVVHRFDPNQRFFYPDYR